MATITAIIPDNILLVRNDIMKSVRSDNMKKI